MTKIKRWVVAGLLAFGLFAGVVASHHAGGVNVQSQSSAYKDPTGDDFAGRVVAVADGQSGTINVDKG
jgi:hypothetical protein